MLAVRLSCIDGYGYGDCDDDSDSCGTFILG
jgi:hypothetical protein